MYKFKISIFIFLLIFCQGCSNTYWVNNRNNANWDIESAQCEAYAKANVPNPVMKGYDFGGTFSGSGVIGSTPYFYSGTISPDHAYNMQAGLNNAANAFTALADSQNIYELCLKSLGWYQIKGDRYNNPVTKGEDCDRSVYAQFSQAKEYIKNNKFSEAAGILQIAADRGDGPSRAILGSLYSSGNGVEKNMLKAKELLEKSVIMGNNIGQYGLGMMYLQGNIVNKDINKAKELLEKSAFDNRKAQSILGAIYASEKYNFYDMNKAKELFEKSSKNLSRNGAPDIDDYYEKAFIYDNDIILQFYKNACKKGIKEGCYNYKRLS